MTPSSSAGPHYDDAAHLSSLGYTSEFHQEMSPWADFAIGLATGGPPMIWWLVIVGR